MSKKKVSKKSQVEKVSKETGVSIADLDRLPQEAIAKIDALVPDSDDDLLGGSISEEPSSPIDSSMETLPTVSPDQEKPVLVVAETRPELGAGIKPELPNLSENPEVGTAEDDLHGGKKHLLGYHPVSGEPVYQE